MKTQDTTLTESDISELRILVAMSLGQWRDAKGSEPTYKAYPAMIDGRIETLKELHTKLDGMLDQ
jgi:hypothetical protein